MYNARRYAALVLSVCLMASPLSGASSNVLGTVVSAERARVSDAAATAGTTVFDGDRLRTEAQGALQVRAGAARLYLAGSSSATLASEGGIPSAILHAGTAIFSTATAKGFQLRAGTAQIRLQADVPTVAQVAITGPKELLVTSRRGGLAITVDDETQIISEAGSYRVLLDPPAAPEPQGPRGAGSRRGGGLPRKAGRNKFLIIVVTATAALTIFAVHEALESPDRP